MEMTFIYTLSDIRGNVRYVGKTTNEIKKRLYSHIIECKTNRKSHKISWIKSLLNIGERPIIEIIDVVPSSKWEFWEIYWIEQFRQWGFNLTNLTIGGSGGNGYKHTKPSKQKMRVSKLGIKLPEEQKKRISDGVKQKFIDNPNYNKSSDKTHIIDKELLYQKYVIENLSLNKCASFFGTAKSTIFHNLKENSITKDKSTWINQVASNPKKVVLQYDLSGNLINEWEGIQVITDSLSINKSNIANCCRGIVISAGGFIWRYKDNFININLSKLKRGREVIQFDKSNNRLKSFDSIKEAGLFSGVRDNNIQDCCVGRIKSAGGFIWRYKNDIDI